MNIIIKKSLRSCALIFICGIICFANYIIYKDTKDYLPHITPTTQGIHYTLERPNWANKQTIKEKVDTLFDNNEYTIIETNFPEGVNGEAKINSRIVLINKKVSLDMYVYTLTHELVHINYKIHAERKTNLITWELLYFSGIDYFKNIALGYAHSETEGRVPYEYCILGYVEHYFV